MSWWGWVLAYFAGATFAFAFLIHLFRREGLKHSNTFNDYVEKLLIGPDPLVLLGTAFWPIAIGAYVGFLLVSSPVAIVWLLHRRHILIRQGIEKLNRKAA